MKKRLIGSLLFGALIMSSSSVFVSCADYDDDINANKAEIVAAQNEIAKLSSSLSALETELKTTKTNLESQLSTLESSFKTQIADAEGRLNKAIATKADQATVDNLIKEVNDLKAAYEANKAAVQAKIDAIDKDIDTLEALIATKADQSALDAAIQTLTAAINGKVDKETYNEAVARISALETQLASLKDLINTLQTEKAALTEVQNKIDLVNKDIEALKEALNGKVSQEAFNSLKATVDGLQTTLTNVQAAFQAALDKKADQATVDALKADVQAKIDELNNQLKNYVTIETFNAAVSRIEGLIASLQNNKADKAEVAALQATLLTVQTAIADLQNNKADKEAVNAALESLRKEVEALVASKADKTEIVRLDNLIEKLEALVIAKEAAIYNEMDAREAAIQALIAALETNKADRTELEAAKTSLENALKEAVDKLNEDIATKYAELNGRIDKAFEELEGIRKDIVGILADLAAATGEIERVETKFDKLIADLQEADKTLDGKIAALEGIVNGHIEAYEIAKKALDQQVAALQAFQKSMEETVIPGLKEDLKNASDELKKKIEAEEAARKAAITEVMNEISGIQNDIATKYAELKKILADKEVEAKALYEGLDKRIKELEGQFAKIDQKIADAISANVENIMVYVSHVLKSISLVPQLYIGGIEAIEFNSLSYAPVISGNRDNKKLASGNPAIGGNGHAFKEVSKGTFAASHVNRDYKNVVTIDNGTAEAYYTLSPANVDVNTIDSAKIFYKSAIAETRAADPYYGTETPVAFAGVANWSVEGQKGLIKVNLKKTITSSLNRDNGEIYIVNLNVPRKTQEVAGVKVDENDEAIITSENHRLAERTFSPRIAHAHWGAKQGEWVGGPENKEYRTWYDPFADAEVKNGYNVHHFTDSATMWKQPVDANSSNDLNNLNLVLSLVEYNKTLDVSKIVTACDIETPMDVEGFAGIDDPASGCYVKDHTQAAHEVTVEKLKSFGLEFRYAIPTTEYKMDVDHSTDQQRFAQIDPITGILSSKLPNGVTNNRACVGKEPIVRVMLIDTKNGGKLVDERYFKIKWVEPTKGTVTLKDWETESVLRPCDINGEVSILWEHFINEVYAKVGDLGLSQNTFERVYPVADVKKSDVVMTWSDGSEASHLSLLSEAVLPGKPSVEKTTNEQGDALIATWQLTPQEIANIYPKQSKTFACTIEFKSILPTEYPNLKFTWKWTIKLPSLPVLNGYYDNYWFTKYSDVDVMPVQYNTAMYNAIKGGKVTPGLLYGLEKDKHMEKYDKANNKYYPGTDYCVFYNNMTNPFTYEQVNGKARFIVKPTYVPAKSIWVRNENGKLVQRAEEFACWTWDMQFTWAGPDAIEAMKNDSKWNNDDVANKRSYGPTGDIEFKGKWTKLGNGGKTYPQATVNGGYQPASNTNSPALSKINWKGAGAYKLETKAGAQALQLEWWKGLTESKPATDTDPEQMGGLPIQTDGHIAWDGLMPYNYNFLYADHHNVANQKLLNQLSQDNEADGWTPVRNHYKDRAVHMGIWGTLNDWNIVPIKDYDMYLIEPLRINGKTEGLFEEGYVSGTCIACADIFTMRDFRGYEVANAEPKANASEREKWQLELYKYYEVGTPDWKLDEVKYGMEYKGGDIHSSDTEKLTAKQIEAYTNGNIVLSITKKSYLGIDYLVFKNNGGSNVEEIVKVYIPVSVDYGFGNVTTTQEFMIYPKGKVPAGKTSLPYPGKD